MFPLFQVGHNVYVIDITAVGNIVIPKSRGHCWDSGPCLVVPMLCLIRIELKA